jgi:hypothetical protein
MIDKTARGYARAFRDRPTPCRIYSGSTQMHWITVDAVSVEVEARVRH